MALEYKICFSIFLLGTIGTIINSITERNGNDFRNHIYSTIPLILSVLAALAFMIWNGLGEY